MTRLNSCLAFGASSVAMLLAPVILRSQSPEVQERVAALKQSVARDQQSLRQYEWIETTVISLKGEEKVRQQKQCYYGADGVLQKVPVDSSPAPDKKRGIRGRV